MLSVIVPTMWKAWHWSKMLPQLDAHPLVGEIIVVDNNTSNTNPEIHNLTKLVYLPQQENIYVNPAWNLGVSVAKYDRFCIINDDCLMNIDCLESIYDQLTPENGVFGFSAASYCDFSLETFEILKADGDGKCVAFDEINPLMYQQFSGMPHPAYGSFMFMHKESYYEIPSEFKIFYGDLFLYLINLKNKKKNYTIENGMICTVMSSSIGLNESGFIENPITLADKNHFVEVLTKFGVYNLDLARLDN
jgi:Glycosyl transferase family 2